MKHATLLCIVMLTPLLFFSPLAVPGSSSAQQAAVQETSTRSDEGKTDRTVFRSISPAAAADLINQHKDLLIVDVRTPQERKQFRIADSLLIPIGDVMRGKFRPEADRPILMICAVGGRSYIAGKVMTARGYQRVYNLEGGIESWRRAGLPLETGPENPGIQ